MVIEASMIPPDLMEFFEPVHPGEMSSVLKIPTQPYAGAHFATFPPKLIEPCIKAGTSEKGCCPACGKPWERVVERDRQPTRPGVRSKVYVTPPVHPGSPVMTHAGDVCGNRDPRRHVTVKTTSGWAQSCLCPPADPVPCLVLDPFNGSGTTGSVATGLGRRYIGFDINPEYLSLAKHRISRPHAPARKVEKPLPLFDSA